MKRNPRLASRWRASKVRRCLQRRRKTDIIDFLNARYEERFFQPIRHLRKAGNLQGYGIAMMSLCSLLVESIGCSRGGLPSTNEGEMKSLSQYKPPKKYAVPKSEWENGLKVFQGFFTRYSYLFPNMDGAEFYRSVRNGLLHQAQTKNGWTIRVGQKRLCDPAEKIIDRNLFVKSLEGAFGKYLDELRANTWTSEIWQKAQRKVWWLIRLSL